jgi:hypothetical protein
MQSQLLDAPALLLLVDDKENPNLPARLENDAFIHFEA